MNGWAIFLYVLEGMSLIGVPLGLRQKGKVETSDGAFLIAGIISLFGVWASVMLTLESNFSGAAWLGGAYIALNVVGILVGGYRYAKDRAYTNAYALWVLCGSLFGVAAISVLSFVS